MDLQKIIGDIASKHGLLLKQKDPSFALLTLNEIVISDYIARCEAAVARSQDELAAGMEQQVQRARQIGERLVTAAGAYVAERMEAGGKTIEAEMVRAVRAELEHVRASARAARVAAIWGWVAAAVATAAAIWVALER